MDKLLIDLPTIITYASDICNDPLIKKRYDNWNERNKTMYTQILDEEKNPVLPKLKETFDGKQLMTTKSAYESAKKIIDQYGSTLERSKLAELEARMRVIDDDPSDRIKNLRDKHWSDLSKIVFGTADKLNVCLVTGNIAALNSLINDHGIDLPYVAHRPRCFVGKRHEKLIE